jgi:PST family polysaccharide transporter
MTTLNGAFRSLLWPAIDTLSTLLIGVVSVLVIARLIGDAAFGLGSIALGLVLILLVGVNSIVHDAMICQEELSVKDIDSAVTASLIAAAGSVVLLGAVAPLVSLFMAEPELTPVIWAFLLLLPLSAISTPLMAERRRLLDFDEVGKHQSAGRFVGAGAGLAGAFLGAGVWSLVAFHLAGAIYVTAAMLVLAPRLPRLGVDWARLAPMLRFCRPIIASQLLVQATARLFLLGIGYWHGVAAAGHWSVAIRISESLVAAATQAIYNVALAYFSRLSAVREQLAEALERAQGVLMLAAIPLMAALAACATPLVFFLLGDEWIPAATLLWGAIVGAFLQMRRMLPNTALRALGRSNISMSMSVVDFAVAAIALLAFGAASPASVAAVAAVAFLPGYALVSINAAASLGRPIATDLLWVLRDLSVAVAAVALGRGAAVLLGSASPAILQIGVSSAVAVATSLALMAATQWKLIGPALRLHGR